MARAGRGAGESASLAPLLIFIIPFFRIGNFPANESGLNMSSETSFSPRQILARLVCGVLLVNLVVGLLATLWLKQNFDQHESDITVNSTNLTLILEQDIEDSIDKIDITLRSVIDEYKRETANRTFQWNFLNDYTYVLLVRQPKLDFLRISDANGNIFFGSGETGNSPTNIADRDLFTRLSQDPAAGMVIAKPFVDKIHGQWMLMFARRLDETDGSFGGVVIAGIALKRLSQLFSGLDVGHYGAVALRDQDLGVVVAIPEPAAIDDASPMRDEMRERMNSGEQAGLIRLSGAAPVAGRTVAFRRVGLYPLFVTVALDARDYLADWRFEAVALFGFFILFLSVTVAIAWQFHRSWTHQAATYRMLRNSEERLRLLAENATDTISRFDADGVLRDISKSVVRLLGHRSEDLVGQRIDDLIHPNDVAALHAARDSLTVTPKPQILSHRFLHKDGHYIWIESNIQAIRNDADQVVEFVAVARDISERKQADARIEFLAHHDPLTNLPNRLLGKDRLELAVARAERSGSKVALLFLDLDQFKRVNDSLGHSIGDALLQSVSARLQGCLRESDTLSRQGGDEFLILLEELRDGEAAARVAETVLTSLSIAFLIDEQELYISGSIGIAIYPDDGTDFDTLLKKADTAMYHAKDAGRNAFRFFTDQMNLDTTEYLNLRNGLRRGLERGEFVLHYQPQIRLRDGAVIGVEALVRWRHPDLGLVPPGRFIPVAEDSGLIVPLGSWVLQEACRQAARWHQMGYADLVVAVNLSAAQFKRGDLLHSINEALADAALDPSFLELELTESILISDTAKVLAMVERLKLRGVKLSIDDFGTGYSSLAYLKRFHVDKLKIDQSFVRDITSDPNDAAIVGAIVQMARSLGLTTIAEGVEDGEALAALRTHGCDEAQGFHLARPMSAEDLEAFLRVPLAGW